MRLAYPCFAFVILAAACGGSDESVPGDDAPEHDAATVDAETSDGAPGGVCGGLIGAECDADEWCDYPDNSCGFDDGTGTCQGRPTVCKPLEEPVCGCDGTVYVTDCAAQLDGVDVNNAGSCTPPAGSFACGHRLCNAASQYCLRVVSDVAGYPDDWFCEPLPGGCGAIADCDCLSGEVCGDMCTVTGDGLRLTCPGG